MMQHESVMLNDVLAALQLRAGSVACDGTLGLAGHARAMAEQIGATGTLIATDWDASMLREAERRLEGVDCRVVLRHSDFRALPAILAELGLRADGMLVDLGLNSAQLDDPQRGFSFLKEGPLDMRMDRSTGEPAAAILNRASVNELEKMLWDLGDERWARRIAQVIVERRKDKPFKTTQDLVDAVLAAVPVAARDKRIHPATRTFMSLRLAVTRELEHLSEAVQDLARGLAAGGRLAAISFHSGEDRAVKLAFRALEAEGFETLTRKPLTPSPEELLRNARSRSAKLRILRRLAEPSPGGPSR
jgi:16S rRNA (cytosine1402-N4)-methyltransferase